MKCFWCEKELSKNPNLNCKIAKISFHNDCFKEAMVKLKQLALERTGKERNTKEKLYKIRRFKIANR